MALPPKILVIEDDEDIVNLLNWHFKAADFTVVSAADGLQGLALVLEERPDLIVLDLMLPGLDGLELCKILKKREVGAAIPIIMLTARGEEADRILGLELGADDYVIKPFSPRELLLRVQAVLRRSSRSWGEWNMVSAGRLTIDPEGHRAWAGDEELALTATEFKLLTVLVENRGKVLGRDRLLDLVWGYQFDGYARTVDTHIRRLRRKLGVHAGQVETIRGVGYRFREDA